MTEKYKAFCDEVASYFDGPFMTGPTEGNLIAKTMLIPGVTSRNTPKEVADALKNCLNENYIKHPDTYGYKIYVAAHPTPVVVEEGKEPKEYKFLARFAQWA